METSQKVKPVLRWAGSKKRLVPQLQERVPNQFNRYVELFAGSACLFFALRPDQSVLVDLNEDVAALYRYIREAHTDLYEIASRLPLGKQAYYEIRDEFNQTRGSVERSALFLYLNRHCFNGVYRENRQGHFNVPFGTKTSGLPTLDELAACSQALQRTLILAADFESVHDHIRPGDFVYLDPPYDLGQRYRGEYGYGTFRRSDLYRFDRFLTKLDREGVHCLVSYAVGPELTTFTNNKWVVENITVQRHVGGFTTRRIRTGEIIARNY